eukprot:COSAG05_NODE_16420_length_346_cov_1.048583_1_plen_29_part_01
MHIDCGRVRKNSRFLLQDLDSAAVFAIPP